MHRWMKTISKLVLIINTTNMFLIVIMIKLISANIRKKNGSKQRTVMWCAFWNEKCYGQPFLALLIVLIITICNFQSKTDDIRVVALTLWKTRFKVFMLKGRPQSKFIRRLCCMIFIMTNEIINKSPFFVKSFDILVKSTRQLSQQFRWYGYFGATTMVMPPEAELTFELMVELWQWLNDHGHDKDDDETISSAKCLYNLEPDHLFILTSEYAL